jgi:hypothetical protein
MKFYGYPLREVSGLKPGFGLACFSVGRVAGSGAGEGDGLRGPGRAFGPSAVCRNRCFSTKISTLGPKMPKNGGKMTQNRHFGVNFGLWRPSGVPRPKPD